MKAIILTAGIGSRIRPLTDNNHKSLIDVGGQTILGRMLDNLEKVGIKDFIVITGYLAEKVKAFIKENYPQLHVTFIHNERYLETNTGYSLLLTREYVQNDDFVKLDGDVVFEQAVIEKVINFPYANCLTIDRTIQLDKEEVKVILGEGAQVKEVGKKLDPHKAHGESIGIEKLSKEAGTIFFEILEEQIIKKNNLQDYYDDSYTTLVQRGIPFHSVDITNLKWVEIDTHEDYANAQKLFSSKK